jgi:Tfp pilus assembly protein PilF
MIAESATTVRHSSFIIHHSSFVAAALAFAFIFATGCNHPFKSLPLKEEQLPARQESELPMSEAAQACVATAKELEQNGHDAEAIHLYERARNYNPKLAVCGRRLAILYERSGRFADALHEYQQALATQPKDATLLNDLGYFYLERGNLVEAERNLRAAVDADRKFKTAWGNLGLALAYQQRFDDAFAAFEKAAGEAEAHANVGLLLVQSGQREAGSRHLRQALEINAELEQPRRVLAWLEQPSAESQVVSTDAVDRPTSTPAREKAK